MAITVNATIQAAIAAAFVSAAGTGAILQHRTGTKPASLGAATGTLLATHTWTGVPIGTATGAVVDIDEVGAINVAGNNVSGTPTWARLMTSGSAVVMDFDYGSGTNNIVKTSDPVSGQPYVLGAWSITVPAIFS